MKVTKEAVMEAVAAGAANLTGIGKHLGVKGNISGSMTKAIRELVPNIADLLAANKGKPQTATPVAAPAEVAEAPAAEAPKAEKTPQAAKAKAAKAVQAGGNPFNPKRLIAVVYDVGSKEYRPLKAILTEAANTPQFKALKGKNGKPLPLGDETSGRYQRAYWQYTMIASNHPTNNGRVKCVSPEGETRKKGHDRLVRFVPVEA